MTYHTNLPLLVVALYEYEHDQLTRLPPTKNHLLPSRSVFAPQIMNETVIDMVHAGMYQTYEYGSLKEAAMRPPILAMTGMGQNDKP